MIFVFVFENQMIKVRFEGAVINDSDRLQCLNGLIVLVLIFDMKWTQD